MENLGGCKQETSKNERENQFFGPTLTISLQLNKNCQVCDALLCIALVHKI